ncbi:MAG: DUF2914 domain-containing protein [Methylococcales bacterium]
MTEKKHRMRGNPSLSDAFSGMDYEIEPKMVEVWNGTRIAWAVAILSALIIIPIVYLLYNSYWSESSNQTETTVENTQQSQSRLEVASAQDTPVVIKAPDLTAQTGLSSSQSSIDNATRALLEQQSLSEVSASIHKNKTEKLKSEKLEESEVAAEPIIAAKTAEITSAAESQKLQPKLIDKSDEQQKILSEAEERVENPTITSVTTSPPVLNTPQAVEDDHQLATNPVDQAELKSSLDEQQLVSDGEEILSAQTTDDVDTQTSPPPVIEADMQLDDEYHGQSEHVNRAHLVRVVRNLEPVGEDIQSVTLMEGQPRRLAYFTEIKGLGGQNITYRWLYEGQLVFSKKVAVTGNYTWRSYISKLLVASMAGQWVVELRDDQNKLLVQENFEVLSGSE